MHRFQQYFSSSSPPSSPSSQIAENITVFIPNRYPTHPSITIYSTAYNRSYETLELKFPTPPGVVPRAFLSTTDTGAGHLAVSFRIPYGPRTKGGPGRCQEMATYEVIVPPEWLSCEQDTADQRFGPTKPWRAEHVWVEEPSDSDNVEEVELVRNGEEADEERETCFRILFYGSRQREDEQLYDDETLLMSECTLLDSDLSFREGAVSRFTID